MLLLHYTGGIVTVKSTHQTNSSYDYTPCHQSNGDVVCDQVPIMEVQRICLKTAYPRLSSIKLILQPFVFTET